MTAWSEAFPEIDVEQELKKIQQWNQANKQKRKTRKGMPRHIVSWLTRASDNLKKSDQKQSGGSLSAVERVEQANQPSDQGEPISGSITIEGECDHVKT